jgi:tetratricopeptide (TPR) repeat protein
MLYTLERRYDEAEALISKALPIQEKIYGPEHHLLVPAWLVMAKISEAKGDLANAKRLLEKAIETVQDQDDAGRLVAGDVLIQLAQVHMQSKKYRKAEDLLNKALTLLDEKQGTDSDRTALALNSLARVYIERNKCSQAESLCQRALRILEGLFGEDHPRVAEVLQTLVQLHQKTGNTTEVARLQQRMEEIRERRHVAYLPTANSVK